MIAVAVIDPSAEAERAVDEPHGGSYDDDGDSTPVELLGVEDDWEMSALTL